MDVDVTNLDSLARCYVREPRPTHRLHVPPRPMLAPAEAPRRRTLVCIGCGAPLGALSVCSYCRLEA